MITGRSASRSSATARSSMRPSGAAGKCGTRSAGSVSSASMKTWSSGKSRNVGPECGRSASRQASSISAGISAVDDAVAASLTSGRTNGTWSISCSEPWPQRIAGARPPSTSIGEWFCCAEPSALIPFVTPGPAVSAQTPGSRVTFAQPSAANAAADSWRTSTRSIPSARQPS